MDDKRLDDELAALTDAVMEGQAVTGSSDIRELEQVVRQLQRNIPRADQANTAFKTRLGQRLQQEWDYQQRPTNVSWFQNPRTRQLVGVAASLALVFAVALIALAVDNGANGDLEGTSVSEPTVIVLIIGVTLGSLLLLTYWRSRR